MPTNLVKRSKEQIKNIYKDINQLINDNSVGEKIRSGFYVSIVGKTNTGKSSFINKIAKRDIAIVTSEPGTTRDIIELFVDLKGLPIKFFDTAGLRLTDNTAEKIGVKKTYQLMEISDVNLIFIEDGSEITEYKNIKNKIYVQSKTDINKKILINEEIFYISSITGKGIDKLIDRIYSYIEPENSFEDMNVSRERHRSALKKTAKYLKKSMQNKNIDLFAEDIRLSVREISKITGNIDIEDILEIIFSDFCIGK